LVSIHPTAIIDADAVINPTAEIGPYCVINGPVHVGADTTVGPYVHLLGHTHIGSDCRIHAGCVVGDLPQDLAFRGAISHCRIGNGTTLREHVTVHRGTAPDSTTRIGERCLVMAGAHVGHNCAVADEAVLVNGVLLGGYVAVGRKAILSGHVAVHQFVQIGELAMIGGLSMVSQDVPPYFLVAGRTGCVGVNSVGLRRAGISSDQQAEIKAAYRILCRNRLSLTESIKQLEATMTTDAGREILRFVSRPSHRGFLLRSDRGVQCEPAE
jgi:UDP-N-acetylglucosamine acyltransferase